MRRCAHWDLIVGLTLLALASVAFAQPLAELRSSARTIAGEISAQKASGSFSAAAQQAAIARLGRLTLGFIDQCDRTTLAGGESAERDNLLSAYEAISAPLEEIYTQHSGAIERAVKQIMAEDGDLEALYETKEFKDHQVIASQALYFLNWLRYYGARLYDGKRRTELLEQARNGFGEFAVGDRRTDLLVESLLGRGLCHLELGDTDFAVHDLKTVANDAQASLERKSKARLALLDAYARAGRTQDALKLSEELLGSGGRTEDNWIRFLRIRLLLDAAKKASAAEAGRYRKDALGLMDQLRRAGGGWAEKVTALAQTGIENPEQWSDKADSPFAKWELAKLLVQKNDFKQATPLLEGFVSSKDAALQQYHDEAHYFLGLAKFQTGDYAVAAQHFDAALHADKPTYGADAAYLRFKALEAMVAKGASSDLAGSYESAIRTYLTRYPDHRSAFEAHYRLGELMQSQGKFDQATDAYALVHGDTAFELQAQFATLQCQFELLQANPPAAQRTALVQEIGRGLPRFTAQAAEYEKSKGRADVPLNAMRGKAAVMRAVYATQQSPADAAAVVEALAGFEKKYPEQQDLLSQVTRLRLTAYQQLGRFADAGGEVQTHGRLLLSTMPAPAIEDLAVSFVREGARRASREGAAVNQAAQRVALRLYELLLADGEGTGKAALTLARLYENTGELKKAEKLYADNLQNGNSPTALRGLARIAEADNRLPDALARWQQLGKTVRPGDLPWYESRYEVARVTSKMGQAQAACDQLTELRPSMPGLSDADLRKQLDALYQQVCR